jgi:hypothetical protein
VAGQALASEIELAPLAAFQEAAGESPADLGSREPAAGAPGALLYRGEGWVGGGVRPVECRSTDTGYRLDVAGIGRFAIAAAGTIDCLRLEVDVDSVPLAEVLLGPALILALGHRDIFCLHAAAVERRGRVVVLIGPSGCGKSTLAASLARTGVWRRVADDVLPASSQGAAPMLLPRFPQLKLAAGEQPTSVEARLRLAGVYELVTPEGAGAAVEVEPVPLGEAALTVARHSIAARLMSPEVLAHHLAFCGAVAERVPVRRLIYPLLGSSIGRAAALLEGEVRAAVQSV